MKYPCLACIIAFVCIGTMAGAAVPRDFAVDLKATVSDASPRITLSWTQRVQSNITAQKIHRRLKGATTWTKLADLTTTQTSYADSTALPNVEYEYWMERNLTGLTPNVAMGYLSAGVKVQEVHSRGILLLVIDDTMVATLAPEIAQLKQDLVADGWTVQTISAPRSGTAVSTKALITSAYNTDPANVKAVYLLGHVPVPYSGNQAPDGHGDHVGAWPADGYYGDMDGTWTDTSVNNISASRAQNDNIPGDGKFDQVSFPSLVELQVGRVDLHTLNRSPSSSVTELARMRRYLRRAHEFKHKLGSYAAIPRRTLIRDGFGHAFTSEPFAITGWMGAFACVGQAPDAPIDEAPSGQWFSASYAGGKDYLWGHGCGGGSYESAGSFGTSVDIGHLTSRVVFTSLFGSYHGDWDADNNLMRTMIAGTAKGDSLGLTCFWAGRPNWFPHHPGMGETMGYMTRASMNAGTTGGGSYVPGGSSFRGVHIGLLGDPALRMHAVEPPRRLAATSANNQVSLSWAASAESGLQGYHVYRAATADGPFTRLSASPIVGTSHVDTTVSAGSTYTYLVRTLKLEAVPGGSYYNLSVGSTVTLTASSGASGIPLNPTELVAGKPLSSTNIPLSWQDNSGNESGFRIERKTNAGGAFASIASVGAGVTSHTDAGPFVNGNVYYYRVIATGAAGDSAASNEASAEAVAGFVEFTVTKTKVNKNGGNASLEVTRVGGSVGAVGVSYATAGSSALAGTHFTNTTGTLTWADGDATSKFITVPITNTVTPQLPRQFKVSLSGASGGVSIAQWSSLAVQIEDPAATLDPAWTSTVLGTLTDSSPAVSAEGAMGDSTIGGAGVTSGATSESGRFIHQTRSGDGVITMQVPTPTPAQSGARFAVMIRASTAGNAIMAATVAASAAANFGSKNAYRSTAGGSAAVTPSGDNDLDTPRWLRLTRAGDTFTSEASADGVTWAVLGSASLPSMPASALWGIFHYSADWASSSTYLADYQLAVYQNVSIGDLPPPAPPSSFSIGTVANTSVPLSWSLVGSAAGYRIERRGDDGSLVIVAEIATGATSSYLDGTIRPDTAYEYRILAYNSGGESAWSPAVKTVVPAGDYVYTFTTGDAGGADAAIKYGENQTNFGGGETLPVADTAIADGSLNPVTKAWLRFDLGSIPSIKSATLKMTYVGEENLTAAFAAGSYYWMTARLLGETADAWEEGTIHWDNAPQNNVGGTGVTGTSQQVVSYFHFDGSTIPAVDSTVSFSLNASVLNANRGANNQLTFALLASAGESGAMIWASHEHPSLPPPTLEITSDNPRPLRPGFLTASSGPGASMTLNWVDFSADESGFQVERRPLYGSWSLLHTTAADATAWSDDSRLPGVIYEYRVRSVSPAGESAWATPVSVTRSSVASITGAIRSSDGIGFFRTQAVDGKVHVPTDLAYLSAPVPFVTGQVLSTSPLRNNLNAWLGMKITVGAQPITLRELGRWVLAGNTGTHVVKVVNVATSIDVPGASVSIPTAGAAVGFAYVALPAPVTLQANTAYYIISQEASGGDQWYEGNTVLSFDSNVAAVNQAAFSGNGVTFTTSYGAGNGYIPLSFKYSPSPVPFVRSHSMSVLRNDVTGWLGMEFTTADEQVIVGQLGRWVVAGNTGTHQVRLVRADTGVTLGSVNVATSGATAGQFSYAPLAAAVTLSPATRYYLLSQETAGGDQWLDFAPSAPGSLTPYQQWLYEHRLSMDGSGTGSAAAEPESDMVPNLVKYALGLDPHVAGSGGRISHGVISDGGQDYMSLTYTYPEPLPAGVTCSVEGGSGVDAGSWTGNGLQVVSSQLNAGLRTIVVRDTVPVAPGSRRFLRLKVVQQ